MPRIARFARPLTLVAGFWLALAAGLLLPSGRSFAQGSGSADIVIDFGNGRVAVDRIAVVSGTLGIDALQQIDLEVTTSGGLVCAIDGLGCPAADCFCACKDLENCRFWGYHAGDDAGDWTAYEIGAGQSRIGPGALEGWVWGRPEPAAAPRSMRDSLLAMDWLLDFQEPSGGMADHVGFTVETIAGARSAGLPLELMRGSSGRSPVDFLRGAAGGYAEASAASAGKALAGVVAAGLDPRRVGGRDLIAIVESSYDASKRWYGASVWDQAWAMIGLAAAGELPPAAAREALAQARSMLGGWGGAPMAELTDSDSTALVLQAMAAAGATVEDPSVASALTWLESMRQADGGFAHDSPDSGSNVNATALVLQSFYALGIDPNDSRWALSEAGPLDYLRSRQQTDGRLQFGAAPVDVSDLVATLQAVPAMAGRGMPMAGTGVGMTRATAWMREHRTPEGGFEGFNPGGSIDAVLALVAAGVDPDRLGAPSTGRVPPVADYLASVADSYSASGPSAAGKLAVGAVALGADPQDFGGVDLIARIESSYDPATGTFGTGGTWDQSWAILGLAAAEAVIPSPAVSTTLRAEAVDGGWGFAALADAADPDSTGLALQALGAAGLDSDNAKVRAGLDYLFESQNADGGWGADGSNASSTAMAIVGLRAMGQHVDGAGWMRGSEGGHRRQAPRDALLALQSPSGAFPGFSGPDDPFSTYAAVLGLSAKPLPLRAFASPTIHLPMLVNGR